MTSLSYFKLLNNNSISSIFNSHCWASKWLYCFFILNFWILGYTGQPFILSIYFFFAHQLVASLFPGVFDLLILNGNFPQCHIFVNHLIKIGNTLIFVLFGLFIAKL